MLTLYTTERILKDIYMAPDDHESKTWYAFITKGNLCSSFKVCLEEGSDYNTNNDNPVYQFAHNYNINVDILNDNQGGIDLSDVIKLNLDAIDDPFAIFLLDIRPDEAKRISAKYGVICHSFQENPDNKCPIFSESNDIYVAKNQQGIGWANLLTPDYVVPTNSLVIIDRYLFSKDRLDKQNYSTAKDGLDNLKDILTNILPEELGEKSEYHILVVFDDFKSEVNPDVSFENISEKINKFKKNLKKKYPIVIETISIDSNNYFYSETHNRRIISNYFIIRAEHSLKAFRSKGLYPQFISFDWAASKGIVRSKKSDIPAKGLFDTLESIVKAIKHYNDPNNKNYENIAFAQNGRKAPLREIKNRMILKLTNAGNKKCNDSICSD